MLQIHPRRAVATAAALAAAVTVLLPGVTALQWGGGGGEALAQAAAGKLPPAVAAVIDTQRVLRESKAGKNIREQVEARRKLYQDQIAKEEQKINDADRELAKQRSVLSAEAFTKRRDDLQKQVAGVQRTVQDRRRQFDQTQAAAYSQLRVAISDIIEGLVEARGFNIVLPSTSVVVYKPEIDLTQEIIKRLDEKLPSVKVPEKVAEKTGR